MNEFPIDDGWLQGEMMLTGGKWGETSCAHCNLSLGAAITCPHCGFINAHVDSDGEALAEQEKQEPVERPPNCGTGYCSCIECIYGKDGCVADEEQCNDGCLARESVIANALKLANDIDAEFFQGRISNHSGRKAAQMLRMLVDAPVQPVKQEPVYAFRRKGLDSFCTCDKERYEELADMPNLFEVTTFYAAPVSAKREWVDLEPWQLCEIEERIGLPIDSHDFETIGNAYIAAFKEKNK